MSQNIRQKRLVSEVEALGPALLVGVVVVVIEAHY